MLILSFTVIEGNGKKAAIVKWVNESDPIASGEQRIKSPIAIQKYLEAGKAEGIEIVQYVETSLTNSESLTKTLISSACKKLSIEMKVQEKQKPREDEKYVMTRGEVITAMIARMKKHLTVDVTVSKNKRENRICIFSPVGRLFGYFTGDVDYAKYLCQKIRAEKIRVQYEEFPWPINGCRF